MKKLQIQSEINLTIREMKTAKGIRLHNLKWKLSRLKKQLAERKYAG